MPVSMKQFHIDKECGVAHPWAAQIVGDMGSTLVPRLKILRLNRRNDEIQKSDMRCGTDIVRRRANRLGRHHVVCEWGERE